MTTTHKHVIAQSLVANVGTPFTTDQINDLVDSYDGTRRLRELRSEGWPIKAVRNGTTWNYTLTRRPNKKMVAQYA